MSALDIDANRRARKYTTRELLLRLLWAAIRPAFRLSPRLPYGWRAMLLRVLGGRIGRGVHIHPTVNVFAPWELTIGDQSSIGDGARIYNLGAIRIGKQVTVSQGAHLCAGTHDYESNDLALLRRPIEVGDMAWVCADAFVGPGVRVGDGAVVAARAVVVRDVPPWTVVAGNPARVVKARKLKDHISPPTSGL